jgi:ankyrin repeat protein
MLMSNPYAVDLPAAPDLGQQRKRAKDLLKAVHAGDKPALARFRCGHPRHAASSDEKICAEAKLSDTQWVIAREYGFSSWPRLKRHIEELAGEPERCRPFETDLQYYRGRAAGMLSVHGTGERNALRLVRQFHPGFRAASEADIRAAALTQADAELILAREHGFATWDDFAGHIEALRNEEVTEPFRQAFEAIRADDHRAFAELIAAHPDLVNAKGTNGNRLLSLAMSFDRHAMFEDLLAAGADPDLPNNKGWTALHGAAYGIPKGDPATAIKMLERLLAAGASVHAEAYGDGGTPLAVALFWGHTVLAERLAREAVTPLNLRIAAGLGRVELMAAFFDKAGKLLPEAGYHREFHRPHSGFPPWRPSDDAGEIITEALGWAARSGRIDAMEFLLARGADIDGEPYNGTALHWAVASRQLDAAAWLLDHGANIDRRAGFGGTRGVTPLHVACAWSGSPACARLLIERGADATIRDPEHGGTPFGWAAHHGNTAIRDELLEIGSRRDPFIAVVAGRLDRLQTLLDGDPALVQARNAHGESLLDAARAQQNEGVVSLLEGLR